MPAQPRTADTAVHVGDARDALVREAALVHARARAAEHLVRDDPAAAAQALRGLTRSSAAVFDVLRAGTREQPATLDGDAFAPTDRLEALRASGAYLSFATSGPEQQLSPDAESALRALMGELLASADEFGSLSVTLTWSPQHLDVLVVIGPPAGSHAQRDAAVAAQDLRRSRDLVHSAGGALRIETPSAGGTVVAATLPLPTRGPRPD